MCFFRTYSEADRSDSKREAAAKMERLKGVNLLFHCRLCRLHLSVLDGISGPPRVHCPAVFFFGAVLVLFVGTLALETASEIHRITKLEYETVTDHLIGVYNRRYLDWKIIEEIARSRRYGSPLALMLLDIDHFKSINDQYGHQIGDDVLKGLGKLLNEKVRDTDIIARYGGKKSPSFYPIPPAPMPSILQSGSVWPWKKTIMVPASENDQHKDIAITVSIGVTEFEPQVAENRLFVQQSDEALYQAKHEGRNRVIAFRRKENA